MNINLPSDVTLTPDLPQTEDLNVIREWLNNLVRELEDMFKKVYYDISLGTSNFRVVGSVPSVDDLREGELVLYDDGSSTRRLYTKMNGSLRYVNLT